LRDPLGLWWFGDPLPQWVMNTGVGLGDGAISAITWGKVSGQDIRDLIPLTRGSNGGADECSRAYRGAYGVGVADAAIATPGAVALKGLQYGRPAVQATVASLQLMTGAADIAVPEAVET
jgi:hypothetical protein